MHGKAAAIAPALGRLGMTVVVPAGLDTDRFRTFSGEVKRTGTMRDAARAKALAAAELAGLLIGIGSKGTYGAHPLLLFGAMGHELLVLVDRETGIEIVLEA